MKRINDIIRTVHRILGTLLSAVFLMWFLTGMVMLFHGSFPSADRSQRLELLSGTLEDLPDVDTITQGKKFTSLSLDRYVGYTVFHLSATDGTQDITLSGKPAGIQIDASYLNHLVDQWCPAEVASCDTLYALDQWIPFGKNTAELPILKYQFNDPQQHQLYVGSKTGNVLQFTTREQRFWAWIGTIPHWVYFTWLRSDRDLWIETVVWISGVGCIMVLTGIWTGVSVWMQTRRQRKNTFSPYKKKWYHWHYITGFLFGLFCLTYVFSGMMSLVKLPPQFISTPQLGFEPQKALDETSPEPYRLDYRTVLSVQPYAVAVTWKHVGRIPFYAVQLQNGSVVNYDARYNQPVEMNLSQQDILNELRAVYQQHQAEASSATTEIVTSPELYYYRVKGVGKDAYPVVKVMMHDVDNGLFYVNPYNGNVRYMNTTARWTYWLYLGLHKMRLPAIMQLEWLRILFSLILMMGGACVSASGVVLGCRYLKRTVKKNF